MEAKAQRYLSVQFEASRDLALEHALGIIFLCCGSQCCEVVGTIARYGVLRWESIVEIDAVLSISIFSEPNRYRLLTIR